MRPAPTSISDRSRVGRHFLPRSYAPLDQWFLYANRATWSGRGLSHGEGRVFSQDGRLLASYSVHAMIRRFPGGRGDPGIDATTAL